MRENMKAISTIIIIILMIISAIVGGIISYAFTIAYYAKIPEGPTLAITSIHIAKENVKSFNLTILNPSYSPKDTTVSRIAISLKNGTQLFDVVETNPTIGKGLEIRRGESVDIMCLKIRKDNTNLTFGEFVNTFAGSTVIVHVFAEGSSAANLEAVLPNVKLNVTADFNRQFSESIEYFNLTIENLQPEPIMNLTLSEVLIRGEQIETDPPLPHLLTPNQKEVFKCKRNWEDLKWVDAKITVKTVEGYELTYVTSKLPGAAIYVDEIKFDFDNTSYFNVTVSSSEYSTGIVYVNRINLTLENGPPIPVNTSYPTNINVLPMPLAPNQSITFKCLWDWYSYRNKTITVTVFTKQGIRTQSNPIRTPQDIIWEISGVNFDLDNVEFFTVNITNRRCSQNNINVTTIKLNGANVNILNQQRIISPGQHVVFNCSISWRNLISTNVTILVTVTAKNYPPDVSNVTVWISPVKLSILDDNFVFSEFTSTNTIVTIPYVNVTVHNSGNSLLNVTITKITLEISYENGETLESKTIEIDGALTFPQLLPEGYTLMINGTTTFICFSNWLLYLKPTTKSITAIVYTSEGFTASKTWYRPNP
jgi:hypothetical protein